MKVLSLFAGIGGFDLGLERAGMRTIAFCERDEFCRIALARLWPDVPCFDDVRTLKGTDVGHADIICGGFPCQDISPSGTGDGLDGERSGLWREYARLIGEVRPSYIIVENSANLIAGADGRWMGTVLGDLAALGYDAEWHVIPLAATGAPHLRERVIIIAYAAGVRQPGSGQLLHAIHPAPDAYREADWLVDAVQAGALPFLCGRHDGVPARLAQAELHAYGNAVGPALIEQVGRAILQAEGRA